MWIHIISKPILLLPVNDFIQTVIKSYGYNNHINEDSTCMKAPSVKILFIVLSLTKNTSTRLQYTTSNQYLHYSSSPSSHLPSLPDQSFVPLQVILFKSYTTLPVHVQDLKTDDTGNVITKFTKASRCDDIIG